jgi:hypothetical protein
MTRKAAAPPRPEQVFFDDPALDRLMGVVMTLAAEHYVLRDRVQALEEQLVAAGHLGAASLAQAPSPEKEAQYRADADDFARALLDPLLGQQQAQGAAGRFSLRRSRA